MNSNLFFICIIFLVGSTAAKAVLPHDSLIKLVVYSSTMCMTFDKKNKFFVQEPCSQNDNQKILLQRVGTKDNIFRFKVGENFEKCLEINIATQDNGGKLIANTCNESDTQKFQLNSSKEDFLYNSIKPVSSNKCLDIAYGLRTAQAPFHQWDCQDDISSQRFLLDPISEKRELPKFVWSYWNQGEDAMPAFYRTNVQLWRKRLGPEWQVRVLNNIPSDEDYFGHFFDKNSIPSEDTIRSKIPSGLSGDNILDSRVIFSDFVRLEILYTEGGFWMDPSVMLHKDLSEFVAPMENLSSFDLAGYTSYHQATRELRYADSLENFFLVSFPRTATLQEWKRNFRKYWDLKTKDMDISAHPMYNGQEGLLLQPEKNFGALANYLNQHVALKYTLIKDSALLNNVLVRGGVRYKDRGPFSLLENVNFDYESQIYDSYHVNTIVERMNDVLISKFGSINSKIIREKMKDEQIFFNPNNIFGRLNAL